MILKVLDKLAYNKIIFVVVKHPMLLAHNKFDIIMINRLQMM